MKTSALFLLLFAASVLPCPAARQMSVADAERAMNAAQTRSSRHLVALLGEIELTERCSTERLERWLAIYPGKKTHDALLALADASAILPPPPGELPSGPEPGPEEQRQILLAARHYVLQTLSALPNFLATRETIYYDDLPSEWQLRYLEPDADSPRRLQVAAHSKQQVAFRNGREVPDRPSAKVQEEFTPSHQLRTGGEFGSVLRIIVEDAAQGTVSWSHWEQGVNGRLAFFRYSVPAAHSHYQMNYACQQNPPEHYPAYDGEFAVDPASGAILRLTVNARLAAPCDNVEGSIVTEFGPVTLGDRSYICPLHSVSRSQFPLTVTPHRQHATTEVLTHELNDVTFTGYRLFHASVRILPDPDHAPQ